MDQLLSILSASSADAPSGVKALLAAAVDRGCSAVDVHISSPGGVGSTELCNFLTTRGFTCNMLQDQDGMRHCPRPPAWQPGPGIPRTVVYLYGDPWPCIASHYRRAQAHHQALKTNENPARVGRLEDFPCSLEQYCDRGEDLLGLNAHFHNWLQGSPHYPITMVRYESLWDPAVALELLRRCCSHKADMHQVQIWTQEWCQARRQRTSQVPPCCHESPLYQELQRVIDEMPPLHG